jgi:hypothetical protein
MKKHTLTEIVVALRIDDTEWKKLDDEQLEEIADIFDDLDLENVLRDWIAQRIDEKTLKAVSLEIDS